MEATTAMTNLGSAITEILGYMGDALTTITSNPILLVSTGIFVIGACIGLAKRMIG
jgi:hypothetical protein